MSVVDTVFEAVKLVDHAWREFGIGDCHHFYQWCKWQGVSVSVHPDKNNIKSWLALIAI